MLTNILPEYLVSMSCVSFIVLGVRKGLKLGIEGNNWKDADEQVNITTDEQTSEVLAADASDENNLSITDQTKDGE